MEKKLFKGRHSAGMEEGPSAAVKGVGKPIKSSAFQKAPAVPKPMNAQPIYRVLDQPSSEATPKSTQNTTGSALAYQQSSKRQQAPPPGPSPFQANPYPNLNMMIPQSLPEQVFAQAPQLPPPVYSHQMRGSGGSSYDIPSPGSKENLLMGRQPVKNPASSKIAPEPYSIQRKNLQGAAYQQLTPSPSVPPSGYYPQPQPNLNQPNNYYHNNNMPLPMASISYQAAYQYPNIYPAEYTPQPEMIQPPQLLQKPSPATPPPAPLPRSTSITSNSAKEKEHKPPRYKPYTLDDYKEMKQDKYIKLGGLGANIGTSEWAQKRSKLDKMYEFAKAASHINRKKISHSGKPPSLPGRVILKEVELAMQKKQKMLEYAKQIPKPKKAAPTPVKADLDPESTEAEGYFKKTSQPLSELEKLELQHNELMEKVNKMKVGLS